MGLKKIELFKTAKDLLEGYGLTKQIGDKHIKGQKKRVYLRGMIQKNDNVSLYLDFYKNGKREKEYLKKVLYPESSKDIKASNTEVIRIATTIASEKNDALQKNELGFNLNSISKLNVIDYINIIANKRLQETGNKRSTYYVLQSLCLHLKLYTKTDEIKFANIDKPFIIGFIEYLKTANNLNYQRENAKQKKEIQLSQNTQHNLFVRLRFILNEAVCDGIIDFNPTNTLRKREKPKEVADTRTFLTVGEVKKLINTDCKNTIIKKAFLFCCFEGLRYSDIKKAVWGDLKTDDEGRLTIHYKAKKTGKTDDLDVSEPAQNYLPNRDNAPDDEVIFKLPKNDHANAQLQKWALLAGINKHVSWHVSRHTCATLLLSLNVPIEVVSKILQHSKISTTQIYAKVLNTKEKEAMEKLNNLF